MPPPLTKGAARVRSGIRLAPQDGHRSEHANGEFSTERFLQGVNQYWNFRIYAPELLGGQEVDRQLAPQGRVISEWLVVALERQCSSPGQGRRISSR